MKFYQVALLSAATVAAAQHHNHAHKHAARHGSPVEARDAAVVTVPGPVITVFELNGHDISYEDVEEGLKNGKYVLIGETLSSVIPATTSAAPSTSSTPKSTPTSTPESTPTPTPTPTPSSSVEQAAEFYQQPSSTIESSTSETPTPTPTPTPSETPTPAPAANSASSDSSSSGSTGNINADFPSGTIKCTDFDSVASYGAVSLDWLGLGGWSGVQNTPNFSGNLLLDTAISFIETAISGSGCTTNSFCSYACPAGYQKVQWPSSQGNTGQSIGGLYCNSNGYLELSRPSVKTICGLGAGGVKVTSSLSQNVAICRTDYPGSESETIPLDVTPGGTFDLTNPLSSDYYTWEGSATTAQYYINPQGASVPEACCWGSAGSNMGNWAPVNCGVGKSSDGITYISLFPNAPTNPDGTLDYNIKITGDVSGDCEYKNGNYYSGGAVSPTGCTVGVTSGGTATFEFS